MSPVLGMGIDVELVEGVGPVIDEPIRSAADVERLRVAEPGGVGRADPRGGADRARRARARARARRLLRRAVHGRGLSRRGEAEPRLRADEGAHVPRAGGVARAHGAADGAVRAVRRRAGGGRRRRDPALRLVGRRPLRRGLSRVRRAVLGARARRRGRADDPLRHRRDDAAARRDGALRAATRSASTGASGSTTRGRRSGTSARSRGTSSRRCCSGRGSAWSGRRSTCCGGRGGRPGHVFNLGHGVLPQTDPDVLTRLAALVAATASGVKAAVVLMAYGSPERLADVPAYYADIRGGRPIAPENLADLVERYRRLGIEDSSPLNAITEETRAALEARARPAGLLRHEALDAADRGRGRAGAGAGAEEIVGLVLAPHYSALSIAGYRTQLEAALADRARAPLRRELARRARLRRAARRARPRHRRARRLHRALAARADHRRGRPVPRPAARDRAPRRRGGGPDASGASPSRASRRRASRGSGRTSSTTSRRCTGRASRACSCARSGSSPTTSRSAGISTSRRRRRQRELGMQLARIEMPNADPQFVRTLAGIVRRALSVPSADVVARAPVPTGPI